jgi:hypothetical protein
MTLKEFARKVFGGQWPILLAIGVGMAAALRLALPDDRAGLLVVRSRTIDFVTTATVSAAMLYVAWTIDPLGTS